MLEAQAQRSAKMRPFPCAAGLSLGNQACLALASELGAGADRRWGL